MSVTEVTQLCFYLVPITGVIALLYAGLRSVGITKKDPGSKRMQDLAGYIHKGAVAFLKKEYKVLAVFAAVVALLLTASYWNSEASHPLIGLAFIVGATFSALAGFFGMQVATKANVRTSNAAHKGLNDALAIAFSGGSVMGMTVVGLGVVGISCLTLIFWKSGLFGTGMDADFNRILAIMSGFSLGASSIALFARVGGGIYTKAADVGADLVGKVYNNLPEDDPRNPASIADNVGDNVGDVAGMGADLFESYVGAIISAMVLAAAAKNMDALFLPLILAGTGILCSIIGTFVVRTKDGGNPQTALNAGTVLAGGLMLVATIFICEFMLPNGYTGQDGRVSEWYHIVTAVVAGLIIGILVGLVTEYYTSDVYKPTQDVAKESVTGSSTNIISGLALGMKSTCIPILLIAIGIVLAYLYGGLYGIAMAAIGMLSTTGIQLAVDAYGPISDNAGGIAEMAKLPPEVRQRTDRLDAVGNTTAAMGKGFAIGSAALTALALFCSFMTAARIEGIDVSDPVVMAGLFIGAMLPYMFSAMSMTAVGKAAYDMIKEVIRQFKANPKLLAEDSQEQADYEKCISIATSSSIKRMVAPGLMAVIVPVIAGFISPSLLGGLLAGCTASGVILAIFMANAGGAWDNAKKHIEGGNVKDDNGQVQGKGSDAHHAAVVGDTVGDPFKDTAGPSINILIKLMSVVALVIAPIIATIHLFG